MQCTKCGAELAPFADNCATCSPPPAVRPIRNDMPWPVYIAIAAALMVLAWWRFTTLMPTISHMPFVLAAVAGIVLLLPVIATIISLLVGARYRIAGIVTLGLVVVVPSAMTLAWEATHDPLAAPRLTWPSGWTALPVSQTVAGNLVTSKAVLTVNNHPAANLIAIEERNGAAMTLEHGLDVVIKSERAFAALKNMTLDVSPPVEVTWGGYRALEYDIVMHTEHGLVHQRSIRTNGAGNRACSLSYVAAERLFDSHVDAYEAVKHQFVCRPDA